jgi:hypothetical protein
MLTELVGNMCTHMTALAMSVGLNFESLANLLASKAGKH